MQELKYIDLFSGAGGLALGLHKSGWQGIFAVEKSKDAFKTLEYNLINKNNNFDWPNWLEKKNYDINDIINDYEDNLTKLKGKVTLIAGGPPCQGFSTAGRRNENDDRNKLIDSYIKFVKLIEPKILFFENVKGFTIGFKSNDKRGVPYSEYVWKKLEALGYDVYGKIINFSEFGVPQKRERFILVAIKTGKAEDFFKNIIDRKEKFLKLNKISEKISLSDAISDLLKSNGTEISPDTKNFKAGVYSSAKTNYQKLMRKNKKLTNKIADSHRFVNHRDKTIEKFKFILKNAEKNKTISDELKKEYNIKKHTTVLLCEKSCTPTLTTLPDDYIHYSEPRILTVREYARIQSFPDDYEFKGKYTTGGKMRTMEVPRYSQIGNAIPPLFAEQAGLVLKDMINE